MITIRHADAEALTFLSMAEALVFSDPWSKEQLAAHLTLPYGRALICEDSGKYYGYLLGSVIEGEGEIFRVAVFPAYRQKGAGEALCRRFLEECGLCFLEVRESNTAARRLYEKLGFTKRGRRAGYYKSPPEDAIEYEKISPKREEKR